MKVYWYYYRSIVLLNIGISFLLSVFDFQMYSQSLGLNLGANLLTRFLLLFLIIGFCISALLDSYFYKSRKYLYYNLGYSRKRIVAGALLINILIVTPILLIIDLWN